MATTALTPARALHRLGELTADVRAAVLLDSGGALAAHSLDDEERGAELAELVHDLVAAADRACEQPVAEVEVGSPRGSVYVVRRGGWTAGVVAGRLALSSLMRYDLVQLLRGLDEPDT